MIEQTVDIAARFGHVLVFRPPVELWLLVSLYGFTLHLLLCTSTSGIHQIQITRPMKASPEGHVPVLDSSGCWHGICYVWWILDFGGNQEHYPTLVFLVVSFHAFPFSF